MKPYYILLFAFITLSIAQTVPTSVVAVESGTATFDAGTNVPGIEVKGKSNTMAARAEVSQDSKGLVLQRIEASVPVKSLATGMKVRDEHMRKYIFTTPDGQEPDLHFAADTTVCPDAATSHDFACQLAGNLSIRNTPRPVGVTLRVKRQGGSPTAFRAECDGIVKLSDYGIAAPSQFGVKPANEVKFHVEFTGKEKP